ncbi:MAG: hypothetical protein KZQ64_12560 [gamma proteobacterium symbiont of Bathyaustriella thionipta]|nr:hypothetical protein [gamma proteobacterium symbiont of Bathyaustriella thionipta]MCU7948791.1 hypothetical protein [gamma proteobacterium symbiont of Bathyaustriella thionipta]MCU7954203.1 hypothetical protein [gamma proteobacterium symbiont of Bathyaustriella thionipta]MCU7955249.1 hypothetical protein [gamma proteobacterium symbiont of Bathyaustriella thionipta]MCU7966258.1 hypothetical protein [gamma proteobacterium symbiont of Bathyaustriella thionipta]
MDGFSPLIAVHIADKLEPCEIVDGTSTPVRGDELALLENIGFTERLEAWKLLRSEEPQV